MRLAGVTPDAPAASAAADGDDDLQTIAADKRRAGMLAAWHDLAIFFDRDAFARQIQRFDQLTDGKRCRKAAGLAIDMKFNHRTLLLSGGREFQ